MTRRVACGLVLAAACVVAACAGGPPGPAALDTRNDSCQACRMTVSNARFAAQLVSPGEEPKFFDDIGCLATYLRQEGPVAQGAVAYVADHRTMAWIPAAGAIYTRVPRIETPMSSHLLAHADASSRQADPDTVGGADVMAAEIFGPSGPPSGKESPRR